MLNDYLSNNNYLDARKAFDDTVVVVFFCVELSMDNQNRIKNTRLMIYIYSALVLPKSGY